MAKAKTKAKAKVATRGSWVVQVGSFADTKHVCKLEAKLRAKGYKVYTNKINTYKGELTRVSVGSGLTRQQADNIAARLEASGIAAKVSRDRI
ncbi:MAG: SPOR domain-containing protein [Gammaproteobacteria bacterium]|nr:SPOR domain-containing protein [Gammaproteobacteria bacterium]